MIQRHGPLLRRRNRRARGAKVKTARARVMTPAPFFHGGPEYGLVR